MKKIASVAFLFAILFAANRLRAQPLTVLPSFNPANPAVTYSNLAISGNLIYGGAALGDSNNTSVIYSVDTNGANFTVLHSFTNSKAVYSFSTPVITGNTLYGTASDGVVLTNSVLYALSLTNSNFTVLHQFSDSNAYNITGSLFLTNSVLYGCTPYGMIYSYDLSTSNINEIYTFAPQNIPVYETSSYGVSFLSNGRLYGTAIDQIFSVASNGADFQTVYSLDDVEGNVVGSLLLYSNTIYGVFGSASGVAPISRAKAAPALATPPDSALYGSIFRVGLNGSNLVFLHDFTNGVDGSQPRGSLILLSNTLYGTTSVGGTGGGGTIFSIHLDGSNYTKLYDFSGTAATNLDGGLPVGPLMASGNTLFGITTLGGSNQVGAVFKFALLPAFFDFSAPLAGGDYGLYYLAFSTNFFGYYSTAFFPYLYHFDAGFEYFVDANDGQNGAFFYDFTSSHWWYTSPGTFPYLYDFTVQSWLYYYPNTQNPGHYTTNPRYFYDFNSQEIQNDAALSEFNYYIYTGSSEMGASYSSSVGIWAGAGVAVYAPPTE